MGTWEKDLVALPKGRKAIKCRWVFAIKADGRYKARLVAKGYSQIHGIDYEETFSPVARFESIRFLIAHAALENWEMHGMDVETAFLNGDLDEVLYITQPEGFKKKGKDEHKVYRLRKAIYGLKQASRQWYLKFNKTLEKHGFKRIYSDGGVYVRLRNSNNPSTTDNKFPIDDTDPDVMYIVLYVDDLLIFGPRIIEIIKIKKLLSQEFAMKDLGEAKLYLGLRIIRGKDRRIISIDQESYIDDALCKFGLIDANPVKIPLPANSTFEKNAEQSPPTLIQKYQSLMGTLLYIMLGSRPDIAFHVTRLSRYNSNPTERHYKALVNILKYLKGTKHYKIQYDGTTQAGLLGYSDSTWGDSIDDGHSISGHCFLLANGAVSWTSRRQSTVALSSTEAEYMEFRDTAKQCAWLRTFQSELGYKVDQPTPLCSDNQGAIFIALQPVFS